MSAWLARTVRWSSASSSPTVSIGSFGLGVCAEVFGYDRRHMGLPRVRLRPGQRGAGRAAHRHRHLDHRRARPGPAGALRHRLDHRVGAVRPRARRPRCSTPSARRTRGAPRSSATARAPSCWPRPGLLDGKRVTTHWKWAGELAARFPAVTVDPSVLYVDNGQIITGAGTAAGVDTLLHLVRREWGAAAANALAREMVVPPHRDGGQAQFIDAPVPACQDDLLGAVLEWAGAPPRRGHQRRHPRPPGADEPAQLRPPVQGDDRDDAARLAARPAAGRRRGAAGGDRRPGRGDRPAGRLRHRRRPARAVRPAPRASRRGPTGRRSARASAAGTAPVQLDGHRAGRVGSDQTLVEAEFGQPA